MGAHVGLVVLESGTLAALLATSPERVTLSSLNRPDFLLHARDPGRTEGLDGIPSELVSRGAAIQTRRGQSLPLRLDGSETVFVVRSATLAVRLTLPQGVRQVITLLYPGDVFRANFAPPGTDAKLSAVSPGEILRLRFETLSAASAEHPSVGLYFANAVAQQTARQAIHLTAVAQLNCTERLATFLTELAVYSGAPGPSGGVVFAMPLSRSDMADYLGLNADTLSRTMSRLRADGLLRQPDRQKAFVRDLTELAALTPAAPSLMALRAEVLHQAQIA